MIKKINKEMGYKEHQLPKKRCGNCRYSMVTNPGANIPGLGCKLKKMLCKIGDAGVKYVVHAEAVCDFYVGR
jgi:hypothetical protein